MNANIPAGIHCGVVQDYDYLPPTEDKPGIVVLKVYCNLNEYKIPLYLSEKSSWKIVDLFKSAGLLEECIKNGELYTEWDKLIGRNVYFTSDGSKVTKFILRDVYENSVKE